ncbi:MAG: DUF4037 domain-containing protein [Succinivibrionaceae bacterium]|nr:DUF4037 domain-containing protein [Succinivibrionaceae bacterium]
MQTRSPYHENKTLSRLLSKYKVHPSVHAVGIGGSVAAGTSDHSSDIDIYVFTRKDLSLEERCGIAAEFSSRFEVGGDYFGPDDELWYDELGRECDVVYFDVSWFENSVRSVWLEGRADNGYTTAFLYTLAHLAVEHDPSLWLADLKTLIDTPYPEKLRASIIRRNLMLMKDKPFSSYSQQLRKAIARGDFVSVNHRLAAYLASYFDALFAVNRLLHPGEKRLVDFALKNCGVLPDGFEEDFKRLASAEHEQLPEIIDGMTEKLRVLCRF